MYSKKCDKISFRRSIIMLTFATSSTDYIKMLNSFSYKQILEQTNHV